MLKILIAITSEELSAALSDTLSQYEVHICNTGTEALVVLETLQPDILILDLTLLTVLRQSSFRPRIILALTNLINTAVLQTATDAGVQDIVLIPCTVSYIAKRLDALIGNPSPEDPKRE